MLFPGYILGKIKKAKLDGEKNCIVHGEKVDNESIIAMDKIIKMNGFNTELDLDKKIIKVIFEKE